MPFNKKSNEMKKSIAYPIIVLFSVVLLVSCGGNSLEEKCGPNWSPATELEQEINDLNAALLAYSQNPTTETCEGYKEAYLDYLDALRDWEDCYIYSFSRDDFNQAIDDAEEAINNTECI